MNVTDDIERPGLRFLVVVKRHALENDGFRLFGRGNNQNMTKALPFQAAKRAAQILELSVRDMIAETAVSANLVTVLTDSFGYVEDDGDGEAVILPRQFHKGFAV